MENRPLLAQIMIVNLVSFNVAITNEVNLKEVQIADYLFHINTYIMFDTKVKVLFLNKWESSIWFSFIEICPSVTQIIVFWNINFKLILQFFHKNLQFETSVPYKTGMPK